MARSRDRFATVRRAGPSAAGTIGRVAGVEPSVCKTLLGPDALYPWTPGRRGMATACSSWRSAGADRIGDGRQRDHSRTARDERTAADSEARRRRAGLQDLAVVMGFRSVGWRSFQPPPPEVRPSIMRNPGAAMCRGRNLANC